jgi:hypothetical protein
MRLGLAALMVLSIAAPAHADYGHDDLEEAAKEEENPLSGIVNLRVRNNTNYLIGPYERTQDAQHLLHRPARLEPRFVNGARQGVRPRRHQPGAARHLAPPRHLLRRTRTLQIDVTPGHWVFGLIVDNVWSVAGRDSGRTVKRFTLTPTVVFNLALGYYLMTSLPVFADWTTPTNENRWVGRTAPRCGSSAFRCRCSSRGWRRAPEHASRIAQERTGHTVTAAAPLAHLEAVDLKLISPPSLGRSSANVGASRPSPL